MNYRTPRRRRAVYRVAPFIAFVGIFALTYAPLLAQQGDSGQGASNASVDKDKADNHGQTKKIGPPGPAGPAGPQGPLGPGASRANAAVTPLIEFNANDCRLLGSVKIVVPPGSPAGQFDLTAKVTARITHTQAVGDRGFLMFSELPLATSLACLAIPEEYKSYFSVGGGLPGLPGVTGNPYDVTVFVQAPYDYELLPLPDPLPEPPDPAFEPSPGGTYTFYLYGMMTSGAGTTTATGSPDFIGHANIIAEFHAKGAPTP